MKRGKMSPGLLGATEYAPHTRSDNLGYHFGFHRVRNKAVLVGQMVYFFYLFSRRSLLTGKRYIGA